MSKEKPLPYTFIDRNFKQISDEMRSHLRAMGIGWAPEMTLGQLHGIEHKMLDCLREALLELQEDREEVRV